MKRFPLVVLAILAAHVVSAKPVDVTAARRVAENVLGSVNLIDRSSELGIPELYLFAPVDGHGFVLVAADDCALPVVGYSPTSVFRADVAPVRSWLNSCAGQIADMQQYGIGGSPAVAASWNYWLSGERPAPKSTPIGPLVTTIWGQSHVFQQMCPYDSNANANCLAGCGAIAMAQVMKYWNHPTSGRGNHLYYSNTNNYGPLSANFDTTYAWADMPDTLTWASSQTQQNAVNLLIYHVGVSIEMDYTPSWSNSYVYFDAYYGPSIETALPNHFKYSSSIRAILMSEYSAAEWDSLLMGELQAQRPIIYRGADPQSGGHIFVLDGCDAYGYYHFNWGWSGYGDGFFAIGSLNPDSYSAYNIGNSAVIGIEPLPSDEQEISIEAAANNPEWGEVIGTVGSYAPFSANGELRALAASGYRFDHWSDGSINNPRFFPMCESRRDTAIFVSAGTDTVGYCLPRHRWDYGYSDPQPTYGAVRMLASSLPRGRKLAGVQIFIPSPGTYTVKIHNGNNTQPDILLFTQTYSVSQSDQWVTLNFDSLVSFPTNKNLWLVMYTDDKAYAIPTSRFGGVTGCFYFSGDGEYWYDNRTQLGYMAAMIRAVFISDNPEGIDDVMPDGVMVAVNGRSVTASAVAGADMALYDMSGRLLAASQGVKLHYAVPSAGVYLLRVGDNVKKIVVL